MKNWPDKQFAFFFFENTESPREIKIDGTIYFISAHQWVLLQFIITVPSHGPSDVLGLANSNKTG